MKEQLIEQLTEILNSTAEELASASDFRDCGEWDSMAYLSTVAAIDDAFGVVITEDDFGGIKTLDDFVRVIAAKKGS